MADYIGPTRTRTLAADIAITDGGGEHTLVGSVVFGPCSVSYRAVWSTVSGNRRCQLTLTANSGGSGSTTTATITSPSTPITGTIAISVDTREIVSVGSIPAVLSGPIIIDPGIAWGARAREYQYGSAVATITLMGRSATRTQSTGTLRVSPSWTLRTEAWVHGSGGGTGEHSITVTTPPAAGATGTTSTKSLSGSPSGPLFPYTYTYEAEATSTSASSSVTRTTTGFGETTSLATAVTIISPARAATVHGRLQRMLATWPDPIRYRLTDTDSWTDNSNGSFSASLSQLRYSTEATVRPHTGGLSSDTHSANQWVNVKPSVFGRGGLRCYGPRWDALSIGWTSSQTIDDGTSLTPSGTWGGTWSGSGGASLSVASGAIKITGSAGKKASRTFGASWQAYSRLRLRLKTSTAAHDITLRLGSDTTIGGINYRAKKWTLRTGSGGTANGALLEFASTPVTGTLVNSLSSYGFTFTVGQSITVTHLGAFDSGGNGVTGPREVRLYSGATGSTLLASVTITGDGTLENAFRYKSITPVTISAGSYRLSINVGSFADRGWLSGVDSGTYTVNQLGGTASIGGGVGGPSGGAPETPVSLCIPASLKADYAVGTATDLYVDLGAETSGPGYSVWDFGNQVAAPGAPGEAHASAYFGGGGTLTLEDLGSGDYEVEEIELLTAPAAGGGRNSPKIHAFRGRLLSQVDGILGLTSLVDPSPGTLASLISTINSGGPTGYSAIDLAPGSAGAQPWPLSELTTSRHTSVAIGGFGLLFAMSGSTPAWTSAFDSGAVGPGALPAQWAVGELDWDWQGSDVGGFLWDDGSGGKAIGAGASLGASVWGRVLAPSDTQTTGDDTAPAGRDPVSGVDVFLTDTAGNALATTTTASDGTFAFPALATLSGTVRVKVDGKEGYVDVPISADRSRVVIVRLAPGAGTVLGMATSPTKRVVRAFRDGSNNVVLSFWNRSGWEDRVTGITATGNADLVHDPVDTSARLWLAYEDGGAIKSRYTDNEGGTWSVAVTIASSGTHPTSCIGPTGLRHYFWVDSGAIKTTALDSQGNALISTTTVVASGVAASPIKATHDGALIFLTYQDSGTVKSVVSSDGGKTFS